MERSGLSGQYPQTALTDIGMMKAIVFDMDGVLFDTERLCRDCWVGHAEKYGISDMAEVFPLCIGRNRTDTETILQERYGEKFPALQFCREASEVFWKEIEEKGHPIKAGVSEILEFLSGAGWTIGLASSTGRESVLKHLEKTGLRQYFSVVIGGDQVLHSKPEPDIYLLACRELGADPQDTYAVEDSYHGIRSAYRAGMMPVMIPDLLPETEEMKKMCIGIFPDLLRFRDFLGKNE